MIELKESIDNYEIIKEGEGTEETLQYKLKGVFMQSETVNRNGRMYKLHEMLKEIERYNRDIISNRAGFGELDHPEGSSMNMSKACIFFNKPLTMEGDDVVGEALIFDNIWGNLLINSFIKHGIPFGVSSRGLGELSRMRESKKTFSVVNNFRIITPADVVSHPSAPGAIPKAVLEQIMENDKDITKLFDAELIFNIQKEINKTQSANIDEEVIKQWNNILNSIRG